MKNNSRRDLELMLFGMALHNETRAEMLKEVMPFLLSSEFKDLFDALSGNKKSSVIQLWLEHRGVVIEKGQTAKDSIVREIHASNAESELKRKVVALESAIKLGTAEQVVDKIKALLESAENWRDMRA